MVGGRDAGPSLSLLDAVEPLWGQGVEPVDPLRPHLAEVGNDAGIVDL